MIFKSCVVAAASLLTGSAVLGGCTSEICSNQNLHALHAAEDFGKVAWIYVRECGATTGFSTHIAILDEGQKPLDGGNIFIADDNHGKAPTDAASHVLRNMEIRWSSPTNLVIKYPSSARVFKSEKQLQGITIQYVDATGK